MIYEKQARSFRTVYDIIVFIPERKIVACTWRSDYASSLLSDMCIEHCGDKSNTWQGTASWREIPILEKLK